MNFPREVGYAIGAAVTLLAIRWIGGPISNECVLFFVLVVGARQIDFGSGRQKIEVEVVNKQGEPVLFDVQVDKP